MATKFKLNFEGARFRVKLIDCLTQTNSDVSDVIDQFLVFYPPDGTNFQKQATLVEDPPSSGIFFLEYTNTNPEPSILDQLHKWEYAGRVQLTNLDIFDSAETFVFWVL